MSRFRKPEIINIEGFDLPKYGSLLSRERQHLLEVHRRLFDQTRAFLDLSEEMAEALNLDQVEAWAIINEGLGQATNDQTRVQALPFLMKLQQRLDPENAGREYPTAAVCVLLQSRLDPAWIKAAASELEEAFGVQITKQQITEISKVPFADYLEDPTRETVCRSIVNALPELVFDELLNFLQNEQNQWKTPEPSETSEEVIDPKDPLPLGSELKHA